MRKFFTLLFALLFISASFAQDRPQGTIRQVGENIPVIDGVLDENGAWDSANVYNIDKALYGEAFTFGEVGETTWRALWNEDGIYIYLTTVDDAWYPSYKTGGNSWEYDKPEIYFDVNYLLVDGVGPSVGGSGHYQVAPEAAEAKIDGTLTTQDNGVVYAYLVADPKWSVEYFVPFTLLLTKDGGMFDKTAPMGFDVTMIDRDPGDTARRRAVWANVGAVNESWSNMDDVGYVMLDGAEPGVPVDDITLTGGNITMDNETLQIGAVVLPDDATDKTIKWTMTLEGGGTPRASISKDGVITPVVDETVVVQGVSADGFIFSNEVTVNISGQNPTAEELNFIKNGNFDVYDLETGAVVAPWTGGSIVVDGVASMNNEEADADPWGWIMGQVVNVPYERKAESFEFSFVMWADAAREVVIDFEDPNHDYQRYGVSTDVTATRDGGGKSDWLLPITTEPTKYTLTMTFENMQEGAKQQMNLMMGWDTPIVYIDSVYLLAVADKELISTGIAQTSMETFKVYPNPAVDKVYVDLSTMNTRVAIYNNVGVKMEEALVTGTHHRFDVSRYPSGLYFIKANEKVVKFIK